MSRAVGMHPQPQIDRGGRVSPELGPDGIEWAKTEAGYVHVRRLVESRDPSGFIRNAPVWHGGAVRDAFVAGAEWQERRGLS